MAMPRPSGKARRIAENVIPGLQNFNKKKSRRVNENKDFMSEVEVSQTLEIDAPKKINRGRR
jgi:hypothetical protein